VNSILAPFGEPIEARPRIPTVEERIAGEKERKAAKDRRAEGKKGAVLMEEMVVDGVAGGKGGGRGSEGC